MPWIKGLSGNPNGRPKKPITDSLRMVLTSDPAMARRIADRMIDIALHDEDPRVALAAAQIIMDRLEGKPIQTIDAQVEHTVVDREERFRRLLELQAKVGIMIDATEVKAIEEGRR